MAKYKKPRRFNFVTLLVVLVLLGCAYSGWKFGPPYWRKWHVKRIVDEAANWGYRRRAALAEHPEMLDQMRERARRQIREAGVLDPSLRIHVKIERNRIGVSAEYHEIIEHPFIKKPTKLYFHPGVVVPES